MAKPVAELILGYESLVEIYPNGFKGSCKKKDLKEQFNKLQKLCSTEFVVG